MAAEEGGAAAEPNVWRGKKAPPDVFVALTTRWREQSGIAKKQAEVLGLFFDETAVLRGDDQRELTEGGGNSEPAQLSCKGNVATEFRIKGDDTRKVWVVAKYGQINPTRMIKYVLTSKVVSDDAKIGLRPRTYSAHQWRSVTTAPLSRETSRAIAQSASALVCQCLDGPAGRPGRFSSSSL